MEITKLKVKRDKNDEEETDISKDQLAGINSALLDGKNLIENNFVKSTLKNGFYFSMATMKFENQSTPEFIELVIDFKSRPERCETNIVSSGFYEEDGLGIRTIKNLFDTETQNNITFNFKNTLYQIYVELLNSEDVPEEPEINISAEEIELLNEEIQSNKNEAAIAVNNNIHLESNKKEQ